MKEAVLAVTSREGVGKNVARSLRREGRIPAALYGPEREPKSVSVAAVDVLRLLRDGAGSNVLISLDIDGKGAGESKSLIRQMQRDPVRGDILHLDFHQISMTRPINLTIPVRLNGTPDGVKNEGGVLQHIIREIEISCLPTNIPDSLELDVSELGIQDSIHVSDVTVENATVLADPDRTIVIVSPPTVSTEKTEEEEAAEAAAEPEVIGAEASAEDDKGKEGEAKSGD